MHWSRTLPGAKTCAQKRSHALGVANPLHLCQLRPVQAQQSLRPTMVRQQSLRNVGDRLSPDAG
jgi:hypothetical protein